MIGPSDDSVLCLMQRIEKQFELFTITNAKELCVDRFDVVV